MSVKTGKENEIVTLEDNSRPGNWPASFYVCSYHKDSFFSDYDHAIQDDNKCCDLCDPCDNDSLGG